MDWLETRAFLSPCFPEELRSELDMLLPGELQEIRIRANKPTVFVTASRTAMLPWSPGPLQLEALVEALSEHSLYARAEETSQGYLTLRGGHRLGICGHVAHTDGRSVLSGIGSVCIRIAAQWPGAADKLMPFLSTTAGGILIIGGPGAGKTTLLRDLARQLGSSHAAEQVAIVDERGELAACTDGVPQLDTGCCSDVLDGLPKVRAIPWLLRSMNPAWIITDELFSEEDSACILEASACGVRVCASVHGTSLADISKRASLSALMKQRIFGLYAVLSGEESGQISTLYGRDGQVLPV